MSEKILIVDDDIDSLKLIGLMLQRHGYEVSAASSGSQALSKALAEIPALVILDVMMPDMNGYEVCRRLRANAETAAIPIIMFTAKTLIDDKVAGFEAGADDYLTKPTHPAELAARVKAILQNNAPPPSDEPDQQGAAIGVLGVKGGVGTTTMALNLAAALKIAGANPILADFRPGNGTLALLMGAQNEQGMDNALGMAAADITPASLESTLFTHDSGLRALLSSTHPGEHWPDTNTEAACAIAKALIAVGHPAVFDLGQGYTPMVRALHEEIDEFIVLVEPTTIAVQITRDLLPALEKRQAPVHIVVVNRIPSGGGISWNEVESALSRDVRAVIGPAPELAKRAADAGVPMVTHEPNAIISSQFKKLVENLSVKL